MSASSSSEWSVSASSSFGLLGLSLGFLATGELEPEVEAVGVAVVAAVVLAGGRVVLSLDIFGFFESTQGRGRGRRMIEAEQGLSFRL